MIIFIDYFSLPNNIYVLLEAIIQIVKKYIYIYIYTYTYIIYIFYIYVVFLPNLFLVTFVKTSRNVLIIYTIG